MSASSSTSLLHHLTKWRRFWRGRGSATSSGKAEPGMPLAPPAASPASGERAPDRNRSARVLWRRCWEAGGPPAYWPWVQALRSYVRDQDPETLLVQLGSGPPDIAQLLPELRDQFPEVRVSASSDPEGARFRLFDSTVAFLRIAAGVQPLVLVLYDLQAADAPSLLLLR